MNLNAKQVWNCLSNTVKSMSDNSWLYTKNPSDYTRQRKITFSDAIFSTISMQKSASKNEVLKYFDYSSNAPSASALIQQRHKISFTAFEDLFYNFTSSFSDLDTYKGFNLIAVDGSDIYIPRNPKDFDTYRITDVYNKGFNMLHLNAAYNLCNKLYTDVIIQSINHINEYQAMCDIIDRHCEYYSGQNTIFIADRGFCSFNVFAHAIENSTYFIIRARDSDSPNSRSLLSTIILPDTDEFDITYERLLSRHNTKVIKANPDKYKYIANREFDYLEPKSNEFYNIKFRIVRFMLPNGNKETLFTNLPPESFSLTELKELYNMRWSIETSFREIKYAAGLLYFHSKSKEFILQEIYSKLILYNFCELIIGSVVIPQKDRKYQYRINFDVAIGICVEYLRRKHNKTTLFNIEYLIAKHLTPIRPTRCSPRYLRARTANTFQYR